MAIDRAARARRRREQRAAEHRARAEQESGAGRLGSAALGVEGLFNPSGKHQLEHKDWVAVAKEDERESGAGPLDLDSGVVRLRYSDGTDTDR